jgi:hypothetical protein
MAEQKSPDANDILRVHGAEALRMAFDRGTDHPGPQPAFRATPYVRRDPATIKPREWHLGRYLSRGIVSMTVAPGGIGKSSLALCEAVSLASGRDLLLYGSSCPLRVWYYNLEDDVRDLAVRIEAICQYYKVSEDAISNRLLVDSGIDRPVCLGAAATGGFMLDETWFLKLEQAIRAQEIDVLILDPFVSSHALDENSNMQMDSLMKRFSRLASRSGCCVAIVHHTRKSGGDGQSSTESARGAKAVSDAARVVRILNRIPDNKAQSLGLETGAGCFNARLGKQNFSAGHQQDIWYRLVDVPLCNGENVGVVERWSPPHQDAGLTHEQILLIQDRCREMPLPASSQASDWVGVAIADCLGLDAKNFADNAQLKAHQKWLLEHGWLRKEKVPVPGKGRDRPMIYPGKDVQHG